MKNVLIVYYSRSGHTEKVVTKLAEILVADVEKLVDLKNRQGIWGFIIGGKDASFKKLTHIEPVKYDAQDYELVIFATPTWASVVVPAVRTYIKQNQCKFNNTAFIVSQGGTCNGKIYKDLETLTGKSPLASADFSSAELQGNDWEEKLKNFTKNIKR